MKFPAKTRVLAPHEGRMHLGKVTSVSPKWRRVKLDLGRFVDVPVGQLVRSPDRVLILEARLDPSLKSDRQYGPMMQQWLSAYGADPLYEKVHTLADLTLFLQREGGKRGTRFIHLMCHGYKDSGGVAEVGLTFDWVNLLDNIDIFSKLNGRIIIFSCCEIGGNRRVLKEIKTASKAAAIIAYRAVVSDAFANLSEVLLYDRLFAGVKPKTAVDQVNSAMEAAGIRNNCERQPVLVCE